LSWWTKFTTQDNLQFHSQMPNQKITLNKIEYVPQGLSLSDTFFLLGINDITNIIKSPIKANLFADDFNFWCKSLNLKTVQHFLQDTANNIAKWATQTYFKISGQKSQCIIFTNKKGQNHINIHLYNKFIPIRNTIKILGINNIDISLE